MTNDEDHGSVRAGNKDKSTINLGVFFLKKKLEKKFFCMQR
jgi:hypothetical protein